MPRRERSAVFQVAGNGAEDHFDAGWLGDPQDVLKIPLEILIDALLAWIIRPDLMVEKHLHSAPGGPPGRFRSETPKQRVEQLSDLRGFKREGETDKTKPGRLRAEYCAGAKRSNEFVVAHIDDPHIAFASGAVARNGQDHMGIDGCHGGANHF